LEPSLETSGACPPQSCLNQVPSPALHASKELDYTPGFQPMTNNSQALTQKPLPDRRRTSRWDLLSDMCKDNSAKDPK
jgi:hypothetical protein